MADFLSGVVPSPVRFGRHSGRSAVGPAPANCPSSTAAPDVGGFPNQLTYAVGGPDVWLDGFDSAHAATSITRDATGPYTQWGWPVPIALVLRDPFHATVTVVGHDMHTHSPLCWAFPANDGSTVMAPTFTIAPQQMNSWSADTVSKWWSGTLYLPGAGCYTLKASWQGGGWTTTFAAGH